MCSLIAFLFLVECHASENSLLFHWGHLSIIVMLLRSKPCPVCSVCLAKREFRFPRIYYNLKNFKHFSRIFVSTFRLFYLA